MALNVWLVYVVAALGLSLSPGPNSLLALTHGALHGRRKTLYTLTGGAAGFVTIIALSMFGIGALLQASVMWLTVLKWVGGAYLIWLGIQVWRAPPIQVAQRSAAANPKGILFFAAFLPQFVDSSRNIFVQFLVMAATFVAIEFLTELCLAILSQRVAGWLSRVGRAFNRVCGGIFVAIGALLPLRS